MLRNFEDFCDSIGYFPIVAEWVLVAACLLKLIFYVILPVGLFKTAFYGLFICLNLTQAW